MPEISVSDEVFSATIGPFTVQLKGRGMCPVHFKNGQIYLGDYQLTTEQQKKLIDLFSEAYGNVRRRNYVWRFLSSGCDYFTGQLHELKGMSSDENRIRYLFCHAERNESNKTAEALNVILPLFYQSLVPDHQKFPALMPDIFKVLSVSESYKYHLSKLEEAFSFLWTFQSVRKVSYRCRIDMYSKYYLTFASDCRKRIMNDNPGFFANFSPNDDTIEREIAESEWAKILYEAFDRFRRYVQESNVASDINIAFDALKKKMDQDPPNDYLVMLKNGQFYHAVEILRINLVDVHADWQKLFSEEENICVHRR